jgi:hypothetical protein
MHVGGPWIAYLLITLFTSVFYPLPFIYALLGIGGLVLYLIQPYRKLGGMYVQRIIGLAAMYVSLILFFTEEGGAYNDSTFREAVPLITLALFVLLSVWQIVLFISDWQKQQKLEQK